MYSNAVDKRLCVAIAAHQTWAEALRRKDPPELVTVLKDQLHNAMHALLVQMSPEIRERSMPVQKLMLEARQFDEAELAFTEHDRIQCLHRPDAVPEFEFRHNQVRIELSRVHELVGF